ncbi:MAG: MobV family relaxase [Clostridia bacterium]
MAHVKKFKKEACGHVFNYYCRLSTTTNHDIDFTKTHLNYNIAEKIQPKCQIDFLKQRLTEVKVQNRKDINIFCDWVISAPKTIDIKDEEQFFNSCFDFLVERYGQENVISSYVHKDQATPHMHFAFVPVVQDKKHSPLEKLSAKECVNLSDLRTFHPQLNKYLNNVFGYDVGVLNGATVNGNKTILELKSKEIENNLKKELAIQASSNDNFPLNLSQLEQRDGKPVYVKFRLGESFGNICENQWMILHISNHVFATCFKGTLLVDFCIKEEICDFFDHELIAN